MPTAVLSEHPSHGIERLTTR